MNKKIILLISLLLTLTLSVCSKETIIDVIIKDNEDNLNYLSILDNGKDKTIGEFSSDELIVWQDVDLVGLKLIKQ